MKVPDKSGCVPLAATIVPLRMASPVIPPPPSEDETPEPAIVASVIVKSSAYVLFELMAPPFDETLKNKVEF